jgi:hypothetical protein
MNAMRTKPSLRVLMAAVASLSVQLLYPWAANCAPPGVTGDTISGVQFLAGTWSSYCDPTEQTGSKMLRGGSEIVVGATINANN